MSYNQDLIKEAQDFVGYGSDLNPVEADRLISELCDALTAAGVAPQEPSEHEHGWDPESTPPRKTCGCGEKPAPSPDREKLTARARVGVHPPTGHVWVEREGRVLAQVHSLEDAEEIVAALAASVAVDEAKLAEVLAQAKSDYFTHLRDSKVPTTKSESEFVAHVLAEWLGGGER